MRHICVTLRLWNVTSASHMCDAGTVECNSCVTYVWRVLAEGLKISEHVPHILEWHISYLFFFIFLTLRRKLSSFFKYPLRLILFDIVENKHKCAITKKKKKIGTFPFWIQRFNTWMFLQLISILLLLI